MSLPYLWPLLSRRPRMSRWFLGRSASSASPSSDATAEHAEHFASMADAGCAIRRTAAHARSARNRATGASIASFRPGADERRDENETMRDRERRRDAASPPGVRECARRGIEASRISGDRRRGRDGAVGERRRPPRRIGFERIGFRAGRGIQNADHGLLHHFKGSPAVNNRRTRRRGPQTSARSLSAHPRALAAGRSRRSRFEGDRRRPRPAATPRARVVRTANASS